MRCVTWRCLLLLFCDIRVGAELLAAFSSVCDAYTRELLPCRTLADYLRAVGLEVGVSAGADVGNATGMAVVARSTLDKNGDENQIVAIRSRIIAALQDQHRHSSRANASGILSGGSNRRREVDHYPDDSFGMLM